jgi:hypothetical protein
VIVTVAVSPQISWGATVIVMAVLAVVSTPPGLRRPVLPSIGVPSKVWENALLAKASARRNAAAMIINDELFLIAPPHFDVIRTIQLYRT